MVSHFWRTSMIGRSTRALLLTCLVPVLSFSSFGQAKKTTGAPTAAEATKFVNDAEKKLSDLADKQQRADWVNETYITDDTDKIITEANNDVSAATTTLALEAKRYDKVKGLSPDVTRKLHLLKLQLTLPTPKDPKLMNEENSLKTEMQSMYGKGKYC